MLYTRVKLILAKRAKERKKSKRDVPGCARTHTNTLVAPSATTSQTLSVKNGDISHEQTEEGLNICTQRFHKRSVCCKALMTQQENVEKCCRIFLVSSEARRFIKTIKTLLPGNESAKELSLPPPAASSSGSGAPASGWRLPSPSSPGQDSRHPGISATWTHSAHQGCCFKNCDDLKAHTFESERLNECAVLTGWSNFSRFSSDICFCFRISSFTSGTSQTEVAERKWKKKKRSKCLHTTWGSASESEPGGGLELLWLIKATQTFLNLLHSRGTCFCEPCLPHKGAFRESRIKGLWFTQSCKGSGL